MGLLSPQLAAGIRRVKGAKRIGGRRGNWLSAEQVNVLKQTPDAKTMRGKRDGAIIAILAGCGLGRSEVAELKVEDTRGTEDCPNVTAFAAEVKNDPALIALLKPLALRAQVIDLAVKSGRCQIRVEIDLPADRDLWLSSGPKAVMGRQAAG